MVDDCTSRFLSYFVKVVMLGGTAVKNLFYSGALLLVLSACGTTSGGGISDRKLESRTDPEQEYAELVASGEIVIEANAESYALLPDGPQSTQLLNVTETDGVVEGEFFEYRAESLGSLTQHQLLDSNIVQIHIFAIGQADSMLIIGPPPDNRTLLVDIGETHPSRRSNCELVRKKVMELTGSSKVDYLMLSHFHLDHIGAPKGKDRSGRWSGGGGVFCLLDGSPEFFKVGTLIDRGDGESEYRPLKKAAHKAIINSERKWINRGTLGQRVPADFSAGLIFLGDGVDIEILAAAGRVAEGDLGALHHAETIRPGTYSRHTQASPNDFSIAFELSIGDFEFFSGGDLTGAPGEPPYNPAFKPRKNEIYTNVESYMVRHWGEVGRESDVEVYRANHHGSRNSSTTDLADALSPEVVIYSCGGKHGHPATSIVERIAQVGADQLVTSKVDSDPWEEGLPEEYGNGWENPVGDISIYVPIGADYYTIDNGVQAFEYPIYNNEEEND